MAKQSILYTCDYCNTTRQTEKGIKSHEATCKHNPAVIETTKKLNTFDAAIEDIRVTAKTVPELLDRIQTFLRTQDIELTFTSTPYQWSDCVSNSHNSPKGYKQNWCGQGDAEGIPKGYPGWQGSWKGSIKYISKTKEITFRDPVVENVVDKFVSRSDVGFAKYGKTLRDDHSDICAWVNHVPEELMDAVLYMQRLKEEITSLFF